MGSVKVRNPGFDALKYICAFLVICIHTDYYGKDEVVLAARMAVPVFFMITGYFYSSVSEKKRQFVQIKKILLLTLLSNLLFLVWGLFEEFVKNGTVYDKVQSWLDLKLWIRFLLFNGSPFRHHLWYLSALLYVLVIAYGLEKIGILRKVYWLIPFLLGINVILGNYSTLLFGEALPLEYSRNFLLAGLPCFLLGDLLHQRRNLKQMKNSHLMIILVLSLAVTWGEYRLLLHCDAYVNQDFFIGTIGMAYAVFSLVKNNPAFFENGLMKRMAWMGKNLSLGLYILNVIVRTVVVALIDISSVKIPLIKIVSDYSMPLIMLMATSCVTYVLLMFWKWIKSFRVKR